MRRRNFLQLVAAAPIAAVGLARTTQEFAFSRFAPAWHVLERSPGRVLVNVQPRTALIDIYDGRAWHRKYARPLPPDLRAIVVGPGHWIAVQGREEGGTWADLVSVPTFGVAYDVEMLVDGRGV